MFAPSRPSDSSPLVGRARTRSSTSSELLSSERRLSGTGRRLPPRLVTLTSCSINSSVEPDTAVPSVRASEKEDRKSTRLNSSHVAISYAVFCLKKKKRKKNTRIGTKQKTTTTTTQLTSNQKKIR